LKGTSLPERRDNPMPQVQKKDNTILSLLADIKDALLRD
jgi:hypothetical protein